MLGLLYIAAAGSVLAAQTIDAIPLPYLIMVLAVLIAAAVISVSAALRTQPSLARHLILDFAGLAHHANQPASPNNHALIFRIHNSAGRPIYYKIEAIRWDVCGTPAVAPFVQEATGIVVPGEREFTSTTIPYDTPLRPSGAFYVAAVIGEHYDDFSHRLVLTGTYEAHAISDGTSTSGIGANIKCEVSAI